MTPTFAENEGRRKDRRGSLRQVLPSGVPASIHLSSGHSGCVTLGDISRAGARIVRRGLMEVKINDQVFLNVSDYALFRNVYLSACVKWMTTMNHKIHMGLAFTEGPVLPGTILDQYFDRALLAPGSLDV
ncbi:PilZ domain-containing protein [Cyanobium gracile]|uniref:PilZ domain-containing protein n=1 Tax=Cyanobium gracile UHCC 0281 TaxID=3110309 RepID=A0ABU5SUU2_9CYAN|nr:PilZ domain-containing protein [Cyanobium gracile UHCC 0281]